MEIACTMHVSLLFLERNTFPLFLVPTSDELCSHDIIMQLIRISSTSYQTKLLQGGLKSSFPSRGRLKAGRLTTRILKTTLSVESLRLCLDAGIRGLVQLSVW